MEDKTMLEKKIEKKMDEISEVTIKIRVLGDRLNELEEHIKACMNVLSARRMKILTKERDSITKQIKMLNAKLRKLNEKLDFLVLRNHHKNAEIIFGADNK